MAVFSGPKISNDGLVFYYDQGNIQRSWKGAPTTNLKSNPDFQNNNTSYEAYVGGTPTAVIVTDFPGNNGAPKVVLQCTSSAAPGGGGNSGGLSFTNPTLTAGLAYTISFWARILSHSSATNTFSNQAGSGDNSNFSFQKTITNNWVKYSFTTSSLDIMKSTWYIWTDLNSATWQYADFQIEQNTFATPFVNGTRSNTQALLDLTGQNTITANSLTYASNNSFSFNGANNYVTTPISLGSTDPLFTVNLWIKRTASFNGAGYWGLGDGNTGDITGGTVAAAANKIGLDLWGQSTFHTGQDYPLNQWVNVCWVKTALTFTLSTLKIYINGVEFPLTTTIRNASSVVNLSSGFQLGRLARRDAQYHAPGIIDIATVYNRALTATEISQNFNAMRSRYGI